MLNPRLLSSVFIGSIIRFRFIVSPRNLCRSAAKLRSREAPRCFLQNRLACLPVKRESPNDQHCYNQQQSPDDDEVEQPTAPALN